MDSRNKKWDLVTFYTTDYAQHHSKLLDSCIKHGIRLHSDHFVEKPTWVECCALKPWVIKTALEHSGAEYVVWTDTDSTIEQYPELFDSFNGVFGVHYREFPCRHLCSGTMIFRVDAAMPIIDRWIHEQERQPEQWDQRTLESVVKPEDITELPAAYCCIYDAADMLSACDHKPVILHHQASRAKKNAENNRKNYGIK